MMNLSFMMFFVKYNTAILKLTKNVQGQII